MNLFTFVWNSLGTALGFVIMALLFASPLIVHPIRRAMKSHQGMRRFYIVVTAVLAFGLLVGLDNFNREMVVLFSNMSTMDHYDYAALDTQVQHCTLDAETCALIDKAPPLGTYDTRPWQLGLTNTIVQLVTALFCAVVGWSLTRRSVNNAAPVEATGT